MKTAIVKTQIWKDNTVYKLNIDTKLLYLFLTTSPERNTTRFFLCPDRLIAPYIGLSDKALELCKSQLEELSLVFFFDDWVIIGDTSYVQPSRGKLTEVIYEKDLRDIPQEVKDFAKEKKLSTEKSSRVAQEYIDIDINKDKLITSQEKIRTVGVEFHTKSDVWQEDESDPSAVRFKQ